MKGSITVIALATLFVMSEQPPPTGDKKKEPSIAKFVSIVTDKCEQLVRELKEAESVYPLLLNSETKLQNGIKKFQSKMDSLRDMLFRISGEYKGRKYYFHSEIYDFEVSSAEAVCNMWGGYLAEITDDDEYEFVKKFLKKETEYDNEIAIVISGSDEVTEELWRYFRSGERISYLKWVHNGPADHDCLALMLDEDFKMQSVGCTSTDIQYGFLCEMEM